jgi:hypothetical protein
MRLALLVRCAGRRERRIVGGYEASAGGCERGRERLGDSWRAAHGVRGATPSSDLLGHPCQQS